MKFFELQRLVDNLVDFLELSMFINAFLPWIYYLMKWIGDSDMKKKHFVRYHSYLLFFKKIVIDELNQCLVVTFVKEVTYCTEKDDNV